MTPEIRKAIRSYMHDQVLDEKWLDGLAAAIEKGGSPPEPPALVTEEMLNEASKIRGGSQRYWTIELEGASALVESAIRRAVERKTEDKHVRLSADGKQATYIHYASVRSVLALFGLEAS